MNDESVLKTLFRLSPPVMLALLIQSFYNIADSFFVAKLSENALTALSIIFPLQLLMNAFANGTSIGINAVVSKFFGMKLKKRVNNATKTGIEIIAVSYVVFAIFMVVLLKPIFKMSTNVEETIRYGTDYGYIIFIFSMFVFAESIVTKLLQAKGNMIVPMAGQIIGAIINIVLDPLLIFYAGMGVKGAAVATVLGQMATVLVMLRTVWREYDWSGKFNLRSLKEIYVAAIPQIILQSLYTVYIMGLNLVLIGFGEYAVMVLGVYYKLQTFTFIPISGLTQVLMPIASYNYGAGDKKKVFDVMRFSIIFSTSFMVINMFIFLAIPTQLVGIFSKTSAVLDIAQNALRIISISFAPCAVVFMVMAFLQATDNGIESIIISVLRQVILLVPVAWGLSKIGLTYTWFTFPITEFITMIVSIILFVHAKRKIERRLKKSTV